jgi:hypothetical protein
MLDQINYPIVVPALGTPISEPTSDPEVARRTLRAWATMYPDHLFLIDGCLAEGAPAVTVNWLPSLEIPRIYTAALVEALTNIGNWGTRKQP